MILNVFGERTCGNCPFNDGQCYTSLPPKYKCTFDNEFYDGAHECHYEFKPVIHAVWYEGDGYVDFVGEDSFMFPTYRCSNCKCEEEYMSDWCPNCGAKMDGKSNE
jgi:hypothetical protein|nr:MAG TPA: zinc-ribbon containing domain protein [Caudoviricetes sp.]